MNRTTKKRLETALYPLLESKNAWVRLNAASILAACNGTWCNEFTNTSAPIPKGVASKIALARKDAYEAAESARIKLKQINRVQYLKRQIKKIEEQNGKAE